MIKLSKKMEDFFLIFIRGLFMGTADIMPGVSGGTIALITGIYERLVHSISKINFKFIKPFLKGDMSLSWKILKEEVDFSLFIPLGLGIGLAIISMAQVMSFMLENYTAFTYAFFSGLILASAYIVYKEIDGICVKGFISLLAGLIGAFLFVGLNPIQANHSLPIIFLSGLLAICAMILPGISGAFVLLLLNQYEYMLNALNNVSLPDIFAFGAGAALGIVVFSRVLDYLLRNYESFTMAFLVGLMLGTLRLPYQKLEITDSGSLLPLLIIGLVGFGLVMVLEKKFRYIDY